MVTDSMRNRELSLPEMLADPMVQAVMTRDGVTKAELESLIGAVANKLGGGRLGSRNISRQEPAATALGG